MILRKRIQRFAAAFLAALLLAASAPLAALSADADLTIGSYAAVLNGLDVLVFTAGIGENNDYVREMICQDMDFLGIKLDAKKNHGINHLFEIGDENAHVKIVVVPTDEEMAIAKETESLVLASKVK